MYVHAHTYIHTHTHTHTQIDFPKNQIMYRENNITKN